MGAKPIITNIVSISFVRLDKVIHLKLRYKKRAFLTVPIYTAKSVLQTHGHRLRHLTL